MMRKTTLVLLSAAAGQKRLVGDVVDGQQLDGGDAEVEQIGDRLV